MEAKLKKYGENKQTIKMFGCRHFIIAFSLSSVC